jgi:hypothetical protein
MMTPPSGPVTPLKPGEVPKVKLRVINWKGVGYFILFLSYNGFLIYGSLKWAVYWFAPIRPDEGYTTPDYFFVTLLVMVIGTFGVAIAAALVGLLLSFIWNVIITEEIEVDPDDIPHDGAGDGYGSRWYERVGSSRADGESISQMRRFGKD